MESLKSELLKLANSYVEERIKILHNNINNLKEALKLETKCSMGDKYETDRAMLHLEFEKLSGQIEQYGQLKKTLNHIESQSQHTEVKFGSIIKTDGPNYFIAIPAGILKYEGEDYYSVGYQTPVAKQLIGKKAGDNFELNAKTFKINEVI
ncbi:transcription elongation factor [Christiangramia aquimixticola]|uniref:transcription elongation factor n=1 Tax=Christiangramia aquimixticola TaxID=1697558 RepID=UPI003AA9B095